MRENFKIGLKHWAGTSLVVIAAGFVIFGLLRGQEALVDFLKSDSAPANLESGDILQLIDPVLTAIPAGSSNKILQTALPSPTVSPINTATIVTIPSLPPPSPTPTFTPMPVSTSTPNPASTSSPTPTISPTPASTLSPVYEQSPQSSKININTADLDELDKITGVGPVIAQRIIDYRNTYGLFQKIEDIIKVNGIGEKNFKKMKDEITV